MKIALLCDYGVDDAAATLYLLKFAERFETVDILPIGGNVPRAVAHDNAKRLLSNIPCVPDNVRLVDTASLPQPEDFLTDIHGNDGMGDILPQDHCYVGDELHYEDWLDGVDKDYIILSLGPCTVTLDILRRKTVGQLIFMCGNIAMPPNYGDYEFNHGMDPDAFAACVKYPHVAVTLDTPDCPQCDFNKLKVASDDLFARIVARAVTLSNERHEVDCAIYDLTAAVYVIYPQRFTAQEMTDPFGNVLSVLKYTSDEPLV
ncbi:MAG: nucleoside hydrolase [Clostridia bacterium]|nr:nucleoside hydrolase [Clostridia bacterium]